MVATVDYPNKWAVLDYKCLGDLPESYSPMGQRSGQNWNWISFFLHKCLFSKCFPWCQFLAE